MPSNRIFTSKTPFVCRSGHGRLGSWWAPGLVCSCEWSGEPSADTKKKEGEEASQHPPLLLTRQRALGAGGVGGWGGSTFATAFPRIVSALAVIKALSPNSPANHEDLVMPRTGVPSCFPVYLGEGPLLHTKAFLGEGVGPILVFPEVIHVGKGAHCLGHVSLLL